MLAEHEDTFPQASVAVQVLVCVPVPAQAPAAKASLVETIGAASQASVTVGATHTGAAGQAIGVVCVAQVIAGAVTS